MKKIKDKNMSAVLTVCNYCVTRSWPLISTDQHNSNELLLAREDVALFLHTLTDGSGYEANTLDQTELHSQVLYWENAEMTVHKIKTNDAQRHKKNNKKKQREKMIRVKRQSPLSRMNKMHCKPVLADTTLNKA